MTDKYTYATPISKSNSKKEKMMTLYQIFSAVDNEDAYVDLKQDDREIVEFINYNKGNHADYGGVVPELASRDHIRRVIPLAEQALAQAQCTLAEGTGIGGGAKRSRRPRSGRWRPGGRGRCNASAAT